MRKVSLALILLFQTRLLSQNTIVLNSKLKSTIVSNISTLLLDNYVFPDTAVKMSSYIMKKLKDGAYNTITDPVAFSDAITIDLHSVYHDRHMLVQFIDSSYKSYMEDGLFMLANLSEAFDEADLYTKHQILGSIFPEKLIFQENKFRTIKYLESYSRMLSICRQFRGKKKWTQTIFMSESTQVAGDGFEPTTFGL